LPRPIELFLERGHDLLAVVDGEAGLGDGALGSVIGAGVSGGGGFTLGLGGLAGCGFGLGLLDVDRGFVLFLVSHWSSRFRRTGTTDEHR
jgi:hypothetical protein